MIEIWVKEDSFFLNTIFNEGRKLDSIYYILFATLLKLYNQSFINLISWILNSLSFWAYSRALKMIGYQFLAFYFCLNFSWILITHYLSLNCLNFLSFIKLLHPPWNPHLLMSFLTLNSHPTFGWVCLKWYWLPFLWSRFKVNSTLFYLYPLILLLSLDI